MSLIAFRLSEIHFFHGSEVDWIAARRLYNVFMSIILRLKRPVKH